MTPDEFERAQDARLLPWMPLHFVINPHFIHEPVTQYARDITRAAFNAIDRARFTSGTAHKEKRK